MGQCGSSGGGKDFLHEVTFTLKSAEVGTSIPCREKSVFKGDRVREGTENEGKKGIRERGG